MFLMSPLQERYGGIYHLVSRIVWKEHAFDDDGKEYFVDLMRKYESFTDLKVLNFCIMCNHVHIMVYVPPARPDELSDEQLLAQLRHIYSDEHVESVAEQLREARSIPDEDKRSSALDRIRTPFTRRMWNFSDFMKSLKQGYSRYYNKREGKEGALWQGRFTSIQVQGGWHARFIAAYIDLNPLRAGMIDDAIDYRWSGLGAAHGNVPTAKDAMLCTLLHESTVELHDAWQARGREHMHEYLVSIREEERAMKGPAAQSERYDWKSQNARYRCFYVEEGQQAQGDIMPGQDPAVHKKRQIGYSPEQLQKTLDEGGKLDIRQMLRCRLRFAVEGLIFGTQEFVQESFEALKKALPKQYANRKQGAKKMSFTKDKRICAHRRHTKDAVSHSS